MRNISKNLPFFKKGAKFVAKKNQKGCEAKIGTSIFLSGTLFSMNNC